MMELLGSQVPKSTTRSDNITSSQNLFRIARLTIPHGRMPLICTLKATRPRDCSARACYAETLSAGRSDLLAGFLGVGDARSTVPMTQLISVRSLGDCF